MTDVLEVIPTPCNDNLPYYYRVRLEVTDGAGLIGVDEKSIYPDCNLVPINTTTIQGYTLYPNPATDKIKISGNMGVDPITAVVFDAMGRKVFQKVYVVHNSAFIPIKISSLQDGLYILKLSGLNLQETYRFCKVSP